VIQKNKKLFLIFTLIIFILCLVAGFRLAEIKPLWNDEIHMQIAIIERFSYKDILLVAMTEGNICPLFYLLHKGICDLFKFRLTQPWVALTEIHDLSAQRIMSINPIIFMSLTIAILFYFFSTRFSLWAGGYAFIVSLSSYMIWVYWAEARYYSQWVFLTTAQSLLFLAILEEEKINYRKWTLLVVTHFFMAFTIVLSLVQIVSVSILLWIYRRGKWHHYIFLTLIPAVVCFVYYYFASKLPFWIWGDPLTLIFANIPRDRLFLFFIYAIVLILFALRQKWGRPKIFNEHIELMGRKYFAFFVLIMMAAIAFLIVFILGDTKQQAGFAVSNRYFIFLTPIGIIATALFSIDFVRILSGRKWIQSCLIGGLAFLLYVRISRTIPLLLGYFQIKGFPMQFLL